MRPSLGNLFLKKARFNRSRHIFNMYLAALIAVYKQFISIGLISSQQKYIYLMIKFY